MYRLWMALIIGTGFLGGCASPSMQQGRIGNLEYALVEVRDRQDRLADEFRERLDSMEVSLLQQERFLQDVLAAQDPTRLVVEDIPRRPPPASVSGPGPAPVSVARSPEAAPFEADQAEAVPTSRTPSEPASVPAPRQTPDPEVRPSPAPKPPDSVDSRDQNQAKELYGQALAKYYRGDYAQARADFFAFQERFPNHPLMPNALYWQAETHYAQKQFAQSILVFKELSRRFPKSAKAPDALLKAGFAYEQLGDYPNARFHLRIVIDDYPDTPASRLAQERLSRLPANVS
ncbi:tol-pal system protein YbgF [Desulfonatronum sp. SC1]|uniref:tol-pal system protein YbgF n=1 Tax=Desulfonatronum sp. SC1 TaxID=2109626 RepID=UPI000D322A54|nr:tol-pal system protein YbgF [Desulfonatronum sp. SC1]PTN38703.1 tol-pal system protein YbgF [Desulfonatronum sp. SC1]